MEHLPQNSEHDFCIIFVYYSNKVYSTFHLDVIRDPAHAPMQLLIIRTCINGVFETSTDN